MAEFPDDNPHNPPSPPLPLVIWWLPARIGQGGKRDRVEQGFRWMVQYQTGGGRWVTLATFARPLDADRLLQVLEAADAKRPVRVLMFKVVGEHRPRGE